MKKILSYVVVVLVVVLLSACAGSAGTPGASPNTGGQAAGDGQITLTIAVLSNERFFDSLKQRFEAAHPNIKVHFKEYNASPVDKSASGAAQQMQRNLDKYISTITTELASGKGPDLLVTNYLPYKKYADKNLLTDIGKLMSDDPSFDRNAYFTNVFDSMTYKGGLYALPTSVQFTNLWVGNENVLQGSHVNDENWTWQDFIGRTQPVVPHGGVALGGVSGDSLISLMLNPGIERFVDPEKKEAHFDSPEFKQLLTQAKSMIDQGLISLDADPLADFMNDNSTVFTPYGFRYLNDLLLIPQMTFQHHGGIYRAPNDTPDLGYSFRSNLTLSISSKSEHQQQAWELLKFALSDEIQADQSDSGMRGIPINRNAFHQLAEELKNPQTLGKVGGTQAKPGGKLNVKPATDEQLKQFESYMTGIRSVQETDDKFANLAAPDALAFLHAEKSVDAAASAIQNKVQTYLNE